VTFEQAVLLSAIAGLTIYLGLPVGRLRGLSTRTQALLTAGAGGVILFLLWDILSQAVEPVEHALDAAVAGEAPVGDFAVNAAAFAGSIAIGLLSIVWVTQRMRGSRTEATTPREIAIGTAIGLGLHNFSEGLAVGQSAAIGETAFALVLVIGFALHNATEGFGVVAPLAADRAEGEPRPSWTQLLVLAAIAGGPTFAGTVVGHSVTNDGLSVVFLTLAAGSILYVVLQLLQVAFRADRKEVLCWSVLIGLGAGFLTDMVVTAAGV